MGKVLKKLLIQMVIITTLMLSGLLWVNVSLPASAQMPPTPTPAPPPISMPVVSEPMPVDPYPFEPAPPIPEMGWCSSEPTDEGMSISGTVVDPNGEPVASTSVQIYNPSNDYWCYDVYTDEAGAFQVYSLSAGTWNLSTQATWNEDGTQYYPSIPIEVTLAEGDTTVALSDPLQLTGPQMTGQVLMPDGSNATDGYVSVYALMDTEAECVDISQGDYVVDDYMLMGQAYEFPYMDGTFEVGGLSTGLHCLQVMPPWLQGTLVAPAPMIFTLSDDQNDLSDLGTFQFTVPTKNVEVIVSYLKSDGTTEGLANVNVSLYSESSPGRAEGRTDESGQFTTQVSGGRWHISIYPEYGSGISSFLEQPEPQVVTFVADETEESKTITFDVKVPTAGIRGRIVDSAGNPVIVNDGADGDKIIAEYGSGININIDSTEDWYQVSSMMNENGEFQAMLPAGEYQLRIHVDSYLYPEYYAPPSQKITVGEDQIVDLGDIQLGQINSFVTGRLVSPDGSTLPAPSSSDKTEWYDERYTGIPVVAYNEQIVVHRGIDASGLFTLALQPGEYQMEFYLDPMLYPGSFAPAPRTIQIVAEETIALGDIPLLLPQVGGTITTPDGEPVAYAGFHMYGIASDADCSMEEQEYMGKMWFYGNADESGLFSMGSLPPSDYCLSLEQYWGMGGLFAPDPIRFTIEAGSDAIDLGNVSYQAPNKTIQGTVLSDNEAGDGIAGVMVSASLRDGRGGWTEATTDEDGTFTLAVTGGTWDLTIYPSYSEEMSQGWYSDKSYQTISFEQDQTAETKNIEFRVKVADATITGRIVGPDGAPLTMDSMEEMEEMPYDDYYRYSAISVNAYSRDGYGNSAMVSDDGTFSIQVIGGSYNVSVYVDEYMYPDYYSPEMLSIRVEDSTIADLGNITVGVKNAKISGQVLDPTGAGIAGIPIYGWSQNGGYGNAMTDETGAYVMAVRAGDWEVSTETYMDPNESTGYFLTQSSQQITIAENETKTIDFVAQGVAGSILGEIVDADGLLITDLDVQAYARRIGDVEEGGAVVLAAERQLDPIPTPAPAPYPELFNDYGGDYYYYGYDVVAQSMSEQGRFTLEVPSGVYQVGLYLPPNSDYVFASEAGTSVQDTAIVQASSRGQVAQANATHAGERQVILGTTGADEDVSVKLVLLRNDATIMGTLLDSNGEPATGIRGEVSAWMDGPSNSWQSATIDPETATYEMTVAGGTWHLDYYINSEAYINYGAGESLSVTVEPKGSAQQDITLRSLDAIIQGTITDPDGNPVEWGYVWANVAPSDEPTEMFFYGTGAEVINGEFEMQVISGLAYAVGASGDGNYIQPATQVVTPSIDSPAVVNLLFRTADGTINGTITAIVDDAAQPVEYGYVYGWSDDGQSISTEADEEGHFAFEVASGSIWHLGASWAPNNGQVYYQTPEDVIVDLTNNISGTAELVLEAEDFLMPPPMVSEFETGQSWTQSLADGTRIDIPAGAIALGSAEDTPDVPTAEMPTAPAPSQPVADEEEGDAAAEDNASATAQGARLNITPMVENMPCTLTACPVGYGYNVAVYDGNSGEQIIRNFNEDVTMTFHYTDEEITKMSTDENSIAPAYYSAATKSWTRIDSFTVDSVANQVTAQIGHTGQWALVSSAGAAIQTPTSLDEEPEQTKHLIFLPITVK